MNHNQHNRKTRPTGSLKRMLAEYETLNQSWALAFARGAECEGGKAHPDIAEPLQRWLDLRAVLREHDVI